MAPHVELLVFATDSRPSRARPGSGGGAALRALSEVLEEQPHCPTPSDNNRTDPSAVDFMSGTSWGELFQSPLTHTGAALADPSEKIWIQPTRKLASAARLESGVAPVTTREIPSRNLSSPPRLLVDDTALFPFDNRV